MNIFTEKEPVYAVALLAAILGWLVSTIHEDMGRLPVLEYHLGEVDGQDTLFLRNISRSQSVSGSFLLRCESDNDGAACLADDGETVTPLARPPLWPQHVEATGARRQIQLTFNMPAGTRFDVRFERTQDVDMSDLVFFYVPAPNNTSDPDNTPDPDAASILIVERSLYTRVLANYDRILITALVLSVAVLILAVGFRLGHGIIQLARARARSRGGRQG